MLEIAASLEVKPYLRVNPRRTLSPAHARAGLHRGCIYLPAGGGRTGTGTLARRLAPRCCGDTRVGTASHRGPVAVGEGGDRGTPGRSAHSAAPLGHRLQNRVRPPPDTRFPVLGEEQSALSHRAVAVTVPTSHGKANACEQVQVRGRQVRGSRVVVGVVQPGPPCPAFSTSPLNSRNGPAAPGRGCGAAPRPGSSPRLGAVGMLGGFPEELLGKGEGAKG